MANEAPCDCTDEHHKAHERTRHKHLGDECVHDDGKRHKVHKK